MPSGTDPQAPARPLHRTAKQACTLCARRKVKCDKRLPACGSCTKHEADCVYEEVLPSQRHAKRKADGELLARVSHLEELLRRRGIDPDAADEKAVSQVAWDRKKVKLLPAMDSRPLEQPPILAAVLDLQKSLPLASEVPLELPTRNSAIDASKSSLHNNISNLSLTDPSCAKFMRKWNQDHSAPRISSCIQLSTTTDLLHLHPEPRIMFKLWQVFAERTNPLIKILHVPTVQQKILDVGRDIRASTKSFRVLLLSIYLLALVSLSDGDCLEYFGEGRDQLLHRYKTGAWQSLMAADVFETRELEVLQALFLFLLSEPESESSSTLSALAVRIAQKMGLDRQSTYSGVSLFEQEMRIRLWWQISVHDTIARHASGGTAERFACNLRLPLNVNDAELHPDMVKQPTEHARATEMIYVLMRYEGPNMAHGWGQQGKQPKRLDLFFDDLEARFEQGYLRHCDPSIALHATAQIMAKYAISAARYWVSRVKSSGSTSPHNALFEQAMEVLELDRASRQVPFATQLLWNSGPMLLGAVIQVLSTLRHSGVAGERVAKAWGLVVDFWDGHIDGDSSGEQDDQSCSFFVGLADLTLEAWKGSANAQGSANRQTPTCIKRLMRIRRVADAGEVGGENWEAADLILSNDLLSSQQSGLGELNTQDIHPDLFPFGTDFFFDLGFWNDTFKV